MSKESANDRSTVDSATLPPSEHLYWIGVIAVLWSRLESALEFAICHLYEVESGRGLILTANIGIRSRLDLLRLSVNHGGLKNKRDAAICKKVLDRIDKAYLKRNAAVHGVWAPLNNSEDKAIRMSIRAKGGKLRCESSEVGSESLKRDAAEIRSVASAFQDIMFRAGLLEKETGIA